MLLRHLCSLLPIGIALAAPAPKELSKRYTYDVQEPGALNVYPSGEPFLGEDAGIGFYFQYNGDFRVYKVVNYQNVDVWASNTGKYNCESNNCNLIFQTDGNLVIYVNGAAVWSTNTAKRGSQLWFRNTVPYTTIYGPQGGVVYESPDPIVYPPPLPCQYPGGYCPDPPPPIPAKSNGTSSL